MSPLRLRLQQLAQTSFLSSALLGIGMLAVLGCGIWLVKTLEYEHALAQEVSQLRAEISATWDEDAVNQAIQRHQRQIEQPWQQESLDVLELIKIRIASALTEDAEWQRVEAWYDYWLEIKRPQPELRWAIELAAWSQLIIEGLEAGQSPFIAHSSGDRLRAFRWPDGTVEAYRAYRPAHLDSGNKHPVVLGFHSREGTETLYFHVFDGEKLKRAADKHGFIFMGINQGGLLGRCVHDVSKRAVHETLRHLERLPDVDLANVFFLGHSRGSAAAMHCALEDMPSPRSIAIMAPSVVAEEFTPPILQQMPFLVVTAEDDPHYRVNGEGIYNMLVASTDTEVEYLEIADEDHFFSRGYDHERLFDQVFSFFAKHRANP